MQLLIVGTLGGQLITASKIAMDKGASVTHANSVEQALVVLRSGRGADLMMVDVSLDIRELVTRLDGERIHVPVVACGVTMTRAPPSTPSCRRQGTSRCRRTELIAAVLAAVADDHREMIYRDDAMSAVVNRPADRRFRRLRADHRRERHRQGSAGALSAFALAAREKVVHHR